MDKFEERYKKLNEEQKLAVDNIEGPVFVIAGPGSGKTELLSLRVANILKQTDINPSSILCLTFTDLAAINMRKRLIGLIGESAYKVSINTFHSFGVEVMNKNPEYFYKGANYKPIDDISKYELVENILKNLDHNDPLASYNKNQGYVYIRDIMSRIKDLKENAILPDDFEKIIKENDKFYKQLNPLINEYFQERISKKSIEKINEFIGKLNELEVDNVSVRANGCSPQRNPIKDSILDSILIAFQNSQIEDSTSPISEWKTEFTENDEEKNKIFKESKNTEKYLSLVKIYKQYQSDLRERGFFDYSDMILDVIKALEENVDLKYNIQEKYLYILVDEFQDTNNSQTKLLENIINIDTNEGSPNILVVGDDDQSIYKFQGANIDNLSNFDKKYKNVKKVILKKNYRSTKQIIDFSQEIVKKSEYRLEKILGIEKKLESGNAELKNGTIEKYKFNKELDQFVFIASKVKELHISGTPYSEISIISPKHKSLERASKVLNYFDIPLNYEKDNNITEEKNIIEIINIIKFINSINTVNKDVQDELLPEILSYSFWNISRIDIWKISLEAHKNKKTWLEIMIDYDNEKIKNIANFFITLGSESKQLTGQEIIDLITGAAEMNICNDNVRAFCQNAPIPYTSPYKEYYFSKENFENNRYEYLEHLSNLKQFIRIIKEYKNKNNLKIKDIVDFINVIETHKIPVNIKNELNTDKDCINLLSAHKSKGLEFNTVFIINCDDKEWFRSNHAKLKFPINLPLSPSKEDSDDILRLFYVAITRAKENLFLLNYKFDEKEKEMIDLRFTSDFIMQDDIVEAQGLAPIVQKLQNQIPDSDIPNQMHSIEFNKKIETYKIENFDEQELLKSKLNKYKLSVTHLNNFLNVVNNGPLNFLEQNLLHFPKSQNKESAYGSIVHDCLKDLYIKFKKDKTIPELNFLFKQLDFYLDTSSLNDKEIKELKERGRKELEIYYQNNKNEINENFLLEVDFKNQGVNIEDIILTGKIDKMLINEELKEITVFDYKTGKVLKDLKDKDVKELQYKTQLIFYKILIENSIEYRNYKVNKGILEFITPKKDNTTKKIEYNISESDINELKETIKAVYKKIMNLDFPSVEEYSKDPKGIKQFIEDLINNKK